MELYKRQGESGDNIRGRLTSQSEDLQLKTCWEQFSNLQVHEQAFLSMSKETAKASHQVSLPVHGQRDFSGTQLRFLPNWNL